MNLYKGIILGAMVLFCNNAMAITIDGTDFELFASMESDGTSGQLGYWKQASKFITFSRGTSGSPIGVKNVVLDDALKGFRVAQVNAMGMTTSNTFSAAIASGNVSLLGAGGETLLSAVYSRAGTVNATPILGVNGQLNISGIYTVTGGLFSNAAFALTQTYVEFAFNNVTDLSRDDIWSNTGSIRFYRAGTGNTEEVPEPASMILLGSSLLALGSKRLAFTRA